MIDEASHRGKIPDEYKPIHDQVASVITGTAHASQAEPKKQRYKLPKRAKPKAPKVPPKQLAQIAKLLQLDDFGESAGKKSKQTKAKRSGRKKRVPLTNL